MSDIPDSVASTRQLEVPAILEPTINRTVDFNAEDHPARAQVEIGNNMLKVFATRLLEEANDCAKEFEGYESKVREALGIDPLEACQYDQIKGVAYVWSGELLEGETGELLHQVMFDRFKLKLLALAQYLLQQKLMASGAKVQAILEEKYGPETMIAVVGEHVVEINPLDVTGTKGVKA